MQPFVVGKTVFTIHMVEVKPQPRSHSQMHQQQQHPNPEKEMHSFTLVYIVPTHIQHGCGRGDCTVKFTVDTNHV